MKQQMAIHPSKQKCCYPAIKATKGYPAIKAKCGCPAIKAPNGYPAIKAKCRCPAINHTKWLSSHQSHRVAIQPSRAAQWLSCHHSTEWLSNHQANKSQVHVSRKKYQKNFDKINGILQKTNKIWQQISIAIAPKINRKVQYFVFFNRNLLFFQ